jgi:hypothetical protein
VSSTLPSFEPRNVSRGPEIREIEQRQAFLVGVAEDEAEALLLRVVRLQHLRQELRPEVRDGRAHGNAGPDAARREVLGRKARRCEWDSEVGGALGRRTRGIAGIRQPGDVALDVRTHDGDAGGGQLLGEHLQRARLSRARRAGDQPVPVGHRERDPNLRRMLERPRVHALAELERRTFRRVRLLDRFDEVRHRGAQA